MNSPGVRSLLRWSIGLAVAVLFQPGPSATVADEPRSGKSLLEFVRDAHRASRESIRSCSCRVEFQITISRSSAAPVTQTCSSQYWYSPEAIRARVSENGQDTDYLWKEGVRKEVTRKSAEGRALVSAGRAAFGNRFISRGDAFTRGLLALNVPNSITHVPFEELINRAMKATEAEWITARGQKMVVVRLAFARSESKAGSVPWNVEIHFDPAANYLVRKTIYQSTSGYRREEEVASFKECSPGVFFPERVTGRSGSGNNMATSLVSIFSDIHVNQPLPPGIFHFRYPNGILLTDSIKGTSYRVDPEGNPLSSGQPMARVGPPPLAEGVAPGTGKETEEEPKPLSRWILPCSLLALALGGGGALARRWRGTSKAA